MKNNIPRKNQSRNGIPQRIHEYDSEYINKDLNTYDKCFRGLTKQTTEQISKLNTLGLK